MELIKNEKEYKKALARFEQIMFAEPETPEGKEAGILVLIIESYEAEHHAIPDPDPLNAIKIRMEDLGLKAKDLEEAIGKKSITSLVLNRKRPLTIPMIRKLSKLLALPVDLLIKEYDLDHQLQVKTKV